MIDKRLADYFVVVGLNENITKDKIKQTSEYDSIEPIVDIVLIKPNLGEKVPEGYTCIERTPSGYKADLNHGSIMTAEIYLCFKKSASSLPIIDIGLASSKDETTNHVVILTTCNRHSANVNNTGLEKYFISFLRSTKSPCEDNEQAIVDICVVLLDKGETIPYSYNHIEKSLNTGMLGSKVILCFKKSYIRKNCLPYDAEILHRYPLIDYPTFPLSPDVGLFCLPSGGIIQRLSINSSSQNIPMFSTFVLTLETGQKYFGTAIQFYLDVIDQSLITLLTEIFSSKKLSPLNNQYYRQNQAICIISQWPLFHIFKKFLLYLYRISVSGPQLISLERYISHLMNDIPFPSLQNPCISVQLNTDKVLIAQPDDSPIPISGASFSIFLLRLGAVKCMHLMLLVLLEHKILLHSVHLELLTYIAEALIRVVFPFNWPYPYIPLCPMGMSTVLESPTPFIVGINSEYFDTNFPIPEVTYVNIDSGTIKLPNERINDQLKMIPKTLLSKLQSSLERLYYDLTSDEVFSSLHNNMVDTDFIDAALEIDRNRLKIYEFSIQECFLRFMAGLLRDYKKYLLPITERSINEGVDVKKLFDINAFLKSQDRGSKQFVEQLVASQSFSRFIEERSLGTHSGTISFNFFDDCLEQIGSDKKWLSVENNTTNERMFMVQPPEASNSDLEHLFNYHGFSDLKSELFSTRSASKQVVSDTILCRTKQEILNFRKELQIRKDEEDIYSKSEKVLQMRRNKAELSANSEKVLQIQRNNAEFHAKSMVWNIYGLWFLTLPAKIKTNVKLKRLVLKKALAILSRMHLLKLPCLDQLCYRIMFHLSIEYNVPAVAVRTFYEMKKYKIEPNAVTYAYYNKAMLEGTWSSSSFDSIRWRKLSNYIFAAARFKRAPYFDNNEDEDDLNFYSQFGLHPNTNHSEFNINKISGSTSSSVGDIRRFSDIQSKSNSYDLLEKIESENLPIVKTDTNQSTASFENLLRSAKNQVSSTYNNIVNAMKDGNKVNLSTVESIELQSNQDQLLVGSVNEIETELDSILIPAPDSEDDIDLNEDDCDNDDIQLDFNDSFKNFGAVNDCNNFKDLNALKSIETNDLKINISQNCSENKEIKDLVHLLQYNTHSENKLNYIKENSFNKNDVENSKEINLNDDVNISKKNNKAIKKFNSVENRLLTLQISVDKREIIQVDDISLDFGTFMESNPNSGGPNEINKIVNTSLYGSDNKDIFTAHNKSVMKAKYKFLNESNNYLSETKLAENLLHNNIKIDKKSKKTNKKTDNNVIKKLSKNQTSNFRFSMPDLKGLAASKRYSLDSSNQSKFLDNESFIYFSLCTQTKCNNCSNLLFDEQIISSWSTSDSDLKARCFCCQSNFIPMLHITIKRKVKLNNMDDEILSSFEVEYLSGFVLRKEVENVLMLYGEECFNNPTIKDQHSILYWNMIWYFHRLKLPTHLDEFLCDQDEKKILIETLWEDKKYEETFGLPMYKIWIAESTKTGDENQPISPTKKILQDLIKSMSSPNMSIPILKIRSTIGSQFGFLARGLPQDIYMLALFHFRNISSILQQVDMKYENDYNDLPLHELRRLIAADTPASMLLLEIRKNFGHLKLN